MAGGVEGSQIFISSRKGAKAQREHPSPRIHTDYPDQHGWICPPTALLRSFDLSTAIELSTFCGNCTMHTLYLLVMAALLISMAWIFLSRNRLRRATEVIFLVCSIAAGFLAIQPVYTHRWKGLLSAGLLTAYMLLRRTWRNWDLLNRRERLLGVLPFGLVPLGTIVSVIICYAKEDVGLQDIWSGWTQSDWYVAIGVLVLAGIGLVWLIFRAVARSSRCKRKTTSSDL